jgi:hypothetical protein
MDFGQPERQTHNYVRHGTRDLFAALNVATGEVIASVAPGKPGWLQEVADHFVFGRYVALRQVQITCEKCFGGGQPNPGGRGGNNAGR